MKLIGLQGQRYTLGAQVAAGGEGRIHQVVGLRNQLIKLAKGSIDADLAEKLRVLIARRTPELERYTAWPIDLVSDERAKPVGFVMNRITDVVDIHMAYGPGSRRDTFPNADFRFLLRVATNIARMFALMESQRIVIGDVNHGSIGVSSAATVTLFDIDSIQIEANGKVYRCRVGVADFTPPELQGRDFKEIDQTAQHDRFRLAILLFKLLFLGRHPYVGVFSGRGEMTVERAIREHRFVYGSLAIQWEMRPPPGALTLNAHGDAIVQLFERAFAGAALHRGRPTPTEWIRAIGDLERDLVACGSSHHHARGKPCPWCAVEKHTRVPVFGVMQAITATPMRHDPAGMTLAELMAAIESYPLPQGIAVPPPNLTDLPAPEAGASDLKWTLRAFHVGIAALVVGPFLGFHSWIFVSWLGAIVMLFMRGSYKDKQKPYETAYNDAKKAWVEAIRHLEHPDQGPVTRIKEKARATHQRLQELPAQRLAALQRLETNKRQQQEARYLRQFRISATRLPGIGPSRVATLESFGIETAADISRSAVIAVPGFGEKYAGTLVKWAAGHRKNFQFDPRQPVSPGEIQQVERHHQAEQQRLFQEITYCLRELNVLTKNHQQNTQRLMGQLPTLEHALRAAKANV